MIHTVEVREPTRGGLDQGQLAAVGGFAGLKKRLGLPCALDLAIELDRARKYIGQLGGELGVESP